MIYPIIFVHYISHVSIHYNLLLDVLGYLPPNVA